MIRRVLVAAIVLLSAAAAPAYVRAQDDPFTVRSVEVDVTAADGMAAREKGIAEAQRIAFQRLVTRMVPSGGQGSVPKVEGRQLDDLVRDFEIDSERPRRCATSRPSRCASSPTRCAACFAARK
jgi:hypothetical protein